LSQIAKEAKDCVQECVSEFVSFITSEYLFMLFVVGRVVGYVFALKKKRLQPTGPVLMELLLIAIQDHKVLPATRHK